MKQQRKLLSLFLLLLMALLCTGCAGEGLTVLTTPNPISYTVTDGYFHTPEYTLSREEPAPEEEPIYGIHISVSCVTDLNGCQVTVRLCSKTEGEVYGFTWKTSAHIPAGETVSFRQEIPEDVYDSFSYAKITCQGESATPPPSVLQAGLCRITFVYDGKEEMLKVPYGQTVTPPEVKELPNCDFSGWFTDPALTLPYDFTNTAQGDLTLYGEQRFDTVALEQVIQNSILTGVVTVHCKNYNTNFFGITTQKKDAQGSGVCFYAQNGYYYILTNCHVVQQKEGYSKRSYTVTDYQGKTYTAYLYQNPNKGFDAISPEDDLACLYFKASSTPVTPVSFANADPVIGDPVIAIGSPEGQKNTVTYGKVTGYHSVTLTETDKSDSNVTYPVIRSTALIDHGSSGGPLFDAELHLIGINYASTTDDLSEKHAYSVPLSKVEAFLTKFVWN